MPSEALLFVGFSKNRGEQGRMRFRETEPGFMMRKGFLQIKTGIKLGLYVYF